MYNASKRCDCTRYSFEVVKERKKMFIFYINELINN